MQRRRIQSWLILTLMALTGTVQGGELPRSYVGVTTGALSPKYFQIDDGSAINVGIGFGLRIRGVPGVAVEALWTGSAVPRSSGDPGPSGDTNNRSRGLFGVYRTRGDTYLKLKAGVGQQMTYDDDSRRRRTDLAGGMGLGWRVPQGMLEVEQSFFNADAWLISLSYFYDLY